MIKQTQAEITYKKFPESVRKRKEMYLTDKSHTIFEILDNSVDEYAAGRCTAIAVVVEGDRITVEDNGGGIPITPHKDPEFKGLSQAEVAFTTLHAGGKFGDDSGYQTNTGGLHGVGASCVNAVSSDMTLTIRHSNKLYEVGFEKGHIVSPLKEIAPDKPVTTSGTTVSYVLDDTVWGDEEYDFKKVHKRIRQLAYLNPGLLIFFSVDHTMADGKKVEINEQYMFEDGLKSYIEKLTAKKTLLTDVLSFSDVVDEIEIDIALAYSTSYSQEVYTFCNNISTDAGGDHQTGFRMGVSRAIEKYALDNNVFKSPADFDADDTREGIVAIVSVKAKEPKFEGQGKTKIKMPEVRKAVRVLTEQYLLDFLNKTPDAAKEIMSKVQIASKARNAAKRAKEAARGKQAISESQGLPGKLADCQSKDPKECEIYIVEGKHHCPR